jgi:hypothetical protein
MSAWQINGSGKVNLVAFEKINALMHKILVLFSAPKRQII